MRDFLINKNLSLYYWLRKRIGREWAFRVAISTEKVILIFGRPHTKRHTPEKERFDGREGSAK